MRWIEKVLLPLKFIEVAFTRTKMVRRWLANDWRANVHIKVGHSYMNRTICGRPIWFDDSVCLVRACDWISIGSMTTGPGKTSDEKCMRAISGSEPAVVTYYQLYVADCMAKRLLWTLEINEHGRMEERKKPYKNTKSKTASSTLHICVRALTLAYYLDYFITFDIVSMQELFGKGNSCGLEVGTLNIRIDIVRACIMLREQRT